MSGLPDIAILVRSSPSSKGRSSHASAGWDASPAGSDRPPRSTDPRIAVLPEGPHGLRIVVFTLRDDEHLIVARRVREIFEGR
jgi:hypothetical protein